MAQLYNRAVSYLFCRPLRLPGQWWWYSNQSQSQSHIATDGQSVSMSWCRAQIWDLEQIFFFKVNVLSFGGVLSDERSGLSCVSVFVIEVHHSLVYLQHLHLN
jgi:hypothetical protein